MVDEKLLYLGIGGLLYLYLAQKFPSIRPKSASLGYPESIKEDYAAYPGYKEMPNIDMVRRR